MAKRTVINRAAKAFLNTSDDSDLLVDAINRTTENEFEPQVKDMGDVQEVQHEIAKNANTEELDIKTAPIQEPEKVAKKQPEVIDAAPQDDGQVKLALEEDDPGF